MSDPLGLLDEKDPLGLLDSKTKVNAPATTPPEEMVPEWARKHPNLYGVAGAARETLGPIGEALAMAGGAAIGATATSPSGPGAIAGGVAGAGLGYAGARQALSSIDVALGNKPAVSIPQAAREAVSDVGTGAAMEASGQIAGKATGFGINKTGEVIGKARNAIETIKQAKNKGIDVTLGEATGSANLQRLETGLERLPSVFGISKYRQNVLEQSNNAIKNMVDNYIIDPAASSPGVSNRQYVNKLYENVNSMLKGYEDLPVYPTKTATATKELIDEYPEVFSKFGNKRMLDVLAAIKSEATYAPKSKAAIGPKEISPVKLLQGQGLTHAQAAIEKQKAARSWEEKLVDALQSEVSSWSKSKVTPSTETVQLPKTQITFNDMWKLRDSLGDMVAQAKKKLNTGDLSKAEYRQISKIFGAVSEDMNAWTSQVNKPEIASAIKAANEGYKNYVVKYNLLQEAIDKSKSTVGTSEFISPAKFANNLKRLVSKQDFVERQGMKGIWTDKEINEMSGTANVLQIVKRAGQYAENPPTGDRWGFPALVFGSAYVGGPKTVATELGLASVAKFLTTTEAGKKFALSASKLEPASPEMEKLISNMYNYMVKSGAVSAIGRDTQKSPEQDPLGLLQ